MVVLISDLLDEPERVLHALRDFRHRRHDVVVFHVMDDAEIDLPYRELANFRDVETGRRLAVDPGAFRRTYRGRVDEFLRAIGEGCRHGGVDYHLCRTSQPVEVTLGQYLAFRAGRSR